MSQPSPQRILIINSSPDTCEMLADFFQHYGWNAATLAARRLRDNAMTVPEMMETYCPDVIVFDVALPYETNWQLCERLRGDPHLRCPVVVTTTNEAAVRRLVAPVSRLLEIIGKPYDLEVLHQAVNEVAHGTAATGHDLNRRIGERRLGDRRSSRRGAALPPSGLRGQPTH